jgi:hypothetical protein
MNKGQDTMNFDAKSNLAKLLATENLTVQHDNVKTASFNLEDRVLTIPVFKNPKGAVYDMLVGHEVSHALHTPQKQWMKALKEDKLMEIKDYINVIEDIRIDKKIQKKYPGLVQDYKDGFHILWNDDFFGCNDKDLNKDLMLIDKINLHFKSSKTLDIKFSNADKLFVNIVDQCKTFKDVVEAAKKLAEWQKKQNEKLQKLPNFDEHPLTLVYGEKEVAKDKDGNEIKDDNKDINADQEKSKENKELDKALSEKLKEQSEDENTKSGTADKDSKDSGKDNKEVEGGENQTGNPDGAGGKNVKINMPLKSITQKNVEEKIASSYGDKDHKGYSYLNVPDCNLDRIVFPMKEFIKRGMADAKKNYDSKQYIANLDDFKKFKSDSTRTISYLVKEFEMKKSADGYKRSTTAKTGIIDPLKLHQYKTSEDIFKKLSIIPDAKNHGMILLLDWSGSMSNVIGKTVEQLLQLVWFCQRINIPYKVYFFSDKIEKKSWSERRETAKLEKDLAWNFKAGDMAVEGFNLVEVANHTAKKTALEQSLFLLYTYAKYYDDNYVRNYNDPNPTYIQRFSPPYEFHLSSTPLNESLAAMYKIIPMFRQKYQVDKMSLITLTDGHSNNSNKSTYKTVDGKLKCPGDSYGTIPILKLGSKQIKSSGEDYWRNSTTGLLLEGLKRKFKLTTIGFFLIKNTRRWEFDRYALSDKQQNLPYSIKDEIKQKIRSEFLKNKCASVRQEGYSEYFLINAKTMKVENADLANVLSDTKKGDIKRIFGKSMKNRTVSRVLLSKFIKRVA